MKEPISAWILQKKLSFDFENIIVGLMTVNVGFSGYEEEDNSKDSLSTLNLFLLWNITD